MILYMNKIQWLPSLSLVNFPIIYPLCIPFSGSHSFYWKPLISMETSACSWNYSFWWNSSFSKPLPVWKTIPFSGRQSFWWKPLLLLQTIPFSGNHSFQWKPFLLVEAIPFSRIHSFQWKPFRLLEAIPFSKSHTF